MVHKPFNEKNVVVPCRPAGAAGYGTIGRKIRLHTNWFPLTITKDVYIYHFDINIEAQNGDSPVSVCDGNIPGTSAAAAAMANIPGLAPPSEGVKIKKKRDRRKNKNKPKAEDEENEPVQGNVPVKLDVDESSNKTGTVQSRRIPKPKLIRIFKEFIEAHNKIFENHHLGFDGEKNAYCASLPSQLKNKFVSTVDYTGDGIPAKRFKISITLVKGGDFKLSDYFKDINAGKHLVSKRSYMAQALEIMFNSGRMLNFNLIGRNKFFSSQNEFGRSYPVGEGTEGKIGFYGSMRPVSGTGWKNAAPLMLNLDVAHAAFYQVMPVIDFIYDVLRDALPRDLSRENVTERGRRQIKDLLVKQMIKVEATHFKTYTRKYTVMDIGPEDAFYTFEVKGVKTTVKDYFKKQYGVQLKYPKLPCLKVGKDGKSCMPMEVCNIAPNQKVKGKLTDTQTAAFIKKTAVAPHNRLSHIGEIMKTNRFHEDARLKHMGIEISSKPLELDGRVLPPPQVTMDRPVMVKLGVWDSRSYKFNTQQELTKWVVLDLAFCRYTNNDEINPLFINKLVTLAKAKGMKAELPREVFVHNGRDIDPEIELRKIMQRHSDLRLVLCILGKNSFAYSKIKTIGDRDIKIVTQCVLQINVKKCQDATVDNILLKINSKLGGINFTSQVNPNVLPEFVKIFNEAALVMGADVNHPAPYDKTSPSLVAVVGSCDRYAAKYALEVRHQIHRTEVIKDMEDITKKLLMNFYRTTRKEPTRIIMYRDGVSETQFTQVLSEELMAMRSACTSIRAGYEPSITFICVQKRHNTRLFVADMKDGVGKSGNVPPGTIVDRVITHPTEADFFLCSHQGIQGTSRPSHYHVLWDDSDMSTNLRQMMTYSLCHNYSRCTRSVSIPTPAYYAHLAAFRAKVHLDGKKDELDRILSNTHQDQNLAEFDRYTKFLTNTCNVSSEDIGANQFYV